MNKREFLNNLEQVLEVPEGSLKGDESLDGWEKWDSMALISFMAMADAKLGIEITPTMLGKCRTVAELAELAGIR